MNLRQRAAEFPKLKDAELALLQDAQDSDSCSPECPYRGWVMTLLCRLNNARQAACDERERCCKAVCGCCSENVPYSRFPNIHNDGVACDAAAIRRLEAKP
jgi:hypothetical protein